MFKDSVTVKTTSNSDTQLGVTDWSKPGRVVRKNGSGAALITATQVSRENKGIDTDRILVRSEYTVLGVLNGVAAPIVGHASIILSRPKDADGVFSASMMLDLLCQAVTFLVKGDEPSAIGLAASPGTTHLERLLAGEL